MRWLFVLLIAATASGQKVQRTWYAREYDDVADIHRWIPTGVGDMALATSWSTGTAPRTRATETLTLAGNAVAAEDVTLGSKTYTWTDPLGAADGDVLVGGSADASLNNLIAAIGLGAGAGTVYAAATTANTDATAVAGAGDTMDVTAISYVTATGNAVVTTENMTQGSFSDTTMSGGTVDWNVLDEVVFGEASVVDATLNMNMAEVVVAHATTLPAYTGNIGASGNQWQIEVSSGTTGQANVLTVRGTGTMHIDISAGGVGDVILDSANLTDALFLDGIIRNLFVERGKVAIDSGATLQHRMYVLGSEAIVSIPSSGSEMQQLMILQKAGQVTCARATSTVAGNHLILNGGTWTHTGEISTETRIVIDGGELIYKPSADTAEVPELYAMAGILDLSQTERTIAFTNTIIGPDMDIIGDFVSGGFTSGTSVAIDLRDDYPR